MMRALIFDVDGTLADTENVHRVCFNRAFATAGLDWHWDKAHYGVLLKITGGKERIGHFMDTERAGAYTREERASMIARLHRSKTRFYERIVTQGALVLRPGVAALIEAARTEGVRLAVATTTSPTNVGTLLTSAFGPRAPDLFEVIAAGDSVERKKPAPDVYLSTLAQLELPPSECLVIEDSQNGLRAALAAGLATVVTPSLYTVTEDFTGAARVVRSLAELCDGDTPQTGSGILEALRVIHASALWRRKH